MPLPQSLSDWRTPGPLPGPPDPPERIPQKSGGLPLQGGHVYLSVAKHRNPLSSCPSTPSGSIPVFWAASAPMQWNPAFSITIPKTAQHRKASNRRNYCCRPFRVDWPRSLFGAAK